MTLQEKFAKLGNSGLLLALIGLGGCAGLAVSGSGPDMMKGYVFAFIFWAAVAFGCLGLTLLWNIVTATWGRPTVRIFEAGGSAKVFAFLGVLFIPLILGGPWVYKFFDAAYRSTDPIMIKRGWWADPTWWSVRGFIYLALVALIAMTLRKWSIAQDKTADLRYAQKRTNFASGAMVGFVLITSMAFTDWGMSIDPHWFSSIYGVWYIAGFGLTCVAMATLLVTRFANEEPYKRFVNEQLTRDFGNLLLMFTMLWAYTSLSQFIIIWSGNLPEFSPFYKARTLNGWNVVGVITVVGQFFLPFVLLLSPRVKRVGSLLGALCVWILLIRVIDLYWIIIPAATGGAGPVSNIYTVLGAALGFIGIGGAWLFAFGSSIKEASLVIEWNPKTERPDEYVANLEVSNHA